MCGPQPGECDATLSLHLVVVVVVVVGWLVYMIFSPFLPLLFSPSSLSLSSLHALISLISPRDRVPIIFIKLSRLPLEKGRTHIHYICRYVCMHMCAI